MLLQKCKTIPGKCFEHFSIAVIYIMTISSSLPQPKSTYFVLTKRCKYIILQLKIVVKNNNAEHILKIRMRSTD